MGAAIVMPNLPTTTVAQPATEKSAAPAIVLPNAVVAQSQIYASVSPGENPFAPVAPAGSQQVKAVAPQSLTAPPQAPATQANEDATSGATKGASASSHVDESALRYYAKTRDLNRLGAEMRRLKGLYPDWEASDDLFNQPTTINNQPLWDLFGAGDYTAVRAEIARLASANPEWKPPVELMDKLALAESRKFMDRAYQRGNWQEVVSVGQQQPQLLVCGEMNAMWQVGEALTKTNDIARAFDLYKYILTSCDVPAERLATMQKASLLLPAAGSQSLLAFARTMPDGTSEFANITFDGLRRQINAVIAADPSVQSPAQADLQSFGAYVQTSRSAEDAGLFGWYYYSQQQWQAANAWFLAGTHYGPDLKNVEGVILTLRNMDKTADAFNVASQFAGKSDDLRKEYIEIVAGELTDPESKIALSDKDLATFKTYVFDAKSALGAQALGWKLLKGKNTKDAQALFAQSVQWQPTEGGVIGSAVVASRSRDFAKVASLKQEYADQFAGLKDFNVYTPKKIKRVVTTVSEKPNKPKPSKNWPFF
jgi:hypothetical protein